MKNLDCILIITQILLGYLGLKEVIWRQEGGLLRKIVWATFILLAVIFSVLYPTIEQTQEREEFKNSMASMTSALISEKSDTKDLNELVALKYKEVFKSSQEDARTWAEKFVANLPQRDKEKFILSQEGEILEERLKLKWNPLYQYVLQEFDTRIKVLKDKGLIKDVVESSQDVVLKDKYVWGPKSIRSITFSNGNGLYLLISSANVDLGRLVNCPSIILNVGFEAGTEQGIMIGMGKDNFSIASINPRFDNLIENYSTKEDPLSDKEFIGKIKDAINGLFNYLN